MTRIEDLTDILHNKTNKKYASDKASIIDNSETDISLQVSGSESDSKPLALFSDDDTDPDLISRLYMSYRSRPSMGEGAERWD
jgi:hypothetical protein